MPSNLQLMSTATIVLEEDVTELTKKRVKLVMQRIKVHRLLVECKDSLDELAVRYFDMSE